ncbi:hypothetical protein L596_002594 [Steinernema carpocapsae]|uniref:non-specific serine/threonine protein kinase n=1 Tax=Steinernema carpocapsae TaxID=34508 RepID=A0A4U8UPT3_STECR|nr:hypothetical protein L596_002594 [Steinernema carpocapsae]
MGNVLSSAIPTQILPVEAYIADVPELKFIINLGSTRFMKVARADHHVEGSLVLKVFVLCDQSFSIEPYRDQIFEIRRRLQSCSNCCPFNRVYLANSRCAILSRPYYKDTLYDRMSTRPFIVDAEKRWIAFQLLNALEQCKNAGVCHGDLKSQNVLISSSNWVQVTDFASFKPAFLAMDNPSNFTFFFDTSRRRSCYLAPERFVQTSEVSRLPGEYAGFTEGLTHEMDVYSMACVLIELFTDGQCPFYFGEQMIRYLLCDDKDPAVSDYVVTALQGVNEALHPLLMTMLSKDPSGRLGWIEKFEKLKETFFPPLFDEFVYGYFKLFRAKPEALKNLTTLSDFDQPSGGKILSMEADDTVAKLSHNFAIIWDKLKILPQEYPDMAVLFVSLLTSEMRALRSLSAKLEAVRLLKQLAEISSTLIVTERILPYLMYALSDSFVQVRCEAVYVIADLIESLKDCPKEGYRLFADYLFPKLKGTAVDKSAYVRMALASNLGRFARSSLRFIRDSTSPLNDVDTTSDSGESEIETWAKAKQTLQQAINEIFVVLCTGDNNVRLCLISQPTTLQLCDFFASPDIEVQLSHMITFINDKHDWRLRETFFSSIWIPSSLVNRQRYEIKPILEEGLNDSEEFVILRTIKCIHILCERGVLDKWGLFRMLKGVVRFLAHPNKWLRLAVVNFLVMLDKTLKVADIRCKVTPMVNAYLTQPLIRFDRATIVYQSLKAPIPRVAWEKVSHLNTLLEPVFDQLDSTRNYCNMDNVSGSLSQSKSGMPYNTFHAKDGQNVEAAIQKLRNLGLSDKDMDSKLLAFRDLFNRTSSLRRSALDKQASYGKGHRKEDGVVNLKHHPRVTRRRFDLERSCMVIMAQAEVTSQPTTKANADWKAMFGSEDEKYPVAQAVEKGILVSEERSLGAGPLVSGESSLVNADNAPCQALWATSKVMLESLFHHKHDIYKRSKRSAATFPSNHFSNERDAFYTDAALITYLGRTDVRQVAHLHEHSASVTQLATSSDGMHLASASADKGVRIWSTKQIQGDCSVAIRSEQHLIHPAKVNSVQFLYSRDNHIATGGNDSRITVFDWRAGQVSRMVALDQKADGQITDMYSSGALLYALTHHGSMFCYDFRAPRPHMALRGSASTPPRWKDRLPNKYGLISSFAVDPVSNYWMSLTSTTGHMLLWDIRFGLEVASWSHVISPRYGKPEKKSCRMIKCWANSRPGCESQLFTSSEYNGEVSLWNMATRERTCILWSHKNKPLQYSSDIMHQTTALAVCPSTYGVYTGDSYGAVRFWDLNNASSCAYLSGPARKSQHGEFSSDHRRAVYRNSFHQNGVSVISEDLMVTTNPEGKYDQTAISPHVGDYHRDAITDIVCLAGDLFASSDRSGVVKVWKRFNENRA